ncbi:putative membrane protein YhdT [Amycolatopsis magusensis]|uniref:Membrane protein YhdT n=2 Tax=Amycolatopsis magusensis TaxID=882444 RepID=A0ABS4PSL0_9PSEU|nr:putative membrane protein YhdT [Amycolatopsis magusensis]
MSENPRTDRKDADGETGQQERKMPTVWEDMGGAIGLFYSSFPVMVFVLVNSFAGLMPGIWSAVGVGVFFVVFRAVRKEPLKPAISGFIGIAISGFIAYRTGSAKGFFLVGIWFSLVCFAIVAITIVFRYPLVGVLWSVMNRVPMKWKKDKSSVYGYDLATAALAAVFGARFIVQRWLYEEDYTGWLAFAKIAMGYPLWGLALIVVVWAIRRADKRIKEREAEEGPEPAEETDEEAEARLRQKYAQTPDQPS